jgi:molybdopterin synthase catalytic subunit
MKDVTISATPISPEQLLEGVRQGNPRIGAVVSFVGLMRDINDGDDVSGLFLEHYPGMTEKALQAIVDEARERWNLERALVVHRVGDITPEEPIVVVVAASRHRGEAFQACEFIIDYLKTRAPFWKRERTASGERWVDARHSDDAAEARWKRTD